VGGDPVVILLGSPVTNVCLALLIESSTRHAGSIAWRFLNWKPVVFLGTLSYSLYLWQEIFLDRGSARWVNAFPQNLIFAFLAALASYFLIERSFLHLRGRLRRDAGLPVHVQGIVRGENVAFEPAVPAASRRHR
jgi:peptidoglycan/LPS O-acetylase OafA/YrhL